MVVTASLDVGNLVLTLAGLSFLGLGPPAPAPELGADGARGLQLPAPAVVDAGDARASPCSCSPLVANLAGDGVRDLHGPRSDAHGLLSCQAPRRDGRHPLRCSPPSSSTLQHDLARPTPSTPMLGAHASQARSPASGTVLGYDRPILAQFGTTSTACSTATSGCRCAPAARSPPTSPTTCRPPLELAVAGAAHRARARLPCSPSPRRCSWPGAGLFRFVLWSAPSVPAFLLGIVGILVFYRRPALAAGDRATSTQQRATGPTGLSPSTAAARPARRVVGRDPAPDPAGLVRRPRPGGGDRPGAALVSLDGELQRLRAHRPGQGPDETGDPVPARRCATRSARRCR